MTKLTALCLFSFTTVNVFAATTAQQMLTYRTAPLLQIEQLHFKDLNRNGSLDPYEDWRLDPVTRAENLLAQMTLKEKAGTIMHGTIMHGTAIITDNSNGQGQHYDLSHNRQLISDKKITSLLSRLSADSIATFAAENNKLQELAENTRLGIPISISSDPRNSFTQLDGMSVSAGKFTKWPEFLGFGAINDENITKRYADSVRQEYRATGIHIALSPQADLATEPRWPRIDGTFGENADIVKRMVKAYIEGMQNGSRGLHSGSVVSVVKHWVGYGAAQDGWDSHNAYGKYAVFPGNSLPQHIYPFTGAFEANVAAVMPAYSILKDVQLNGKAPEPVAVGFNRTLLTDLLRRQYGFEGVILSDWLITHDCSSECREGAVNHVPSLPPGAPWGVEKLTQQQRFIKALNAGIDQFGGVSNTDLIVTAVQQRRLDEARLDLSVKRILIQKFAIGLFETPFVDPEHAEAVVGNPTWRKEARKAQIKSLVLLKNQQHILPLNRKSKIFLHNIDAKAATALGFDVVTTPEKADAAVIRIATPYEILHPTYFFGARQHEGSLDFSSDNTDYQLIRNTARIVPTVVTVYLDRPAILGNIQAHASALVANFGISDEALLAALVSQADFSGKLPFELPSSMKAVAEQLPDVPSDSHAPLYHIGFGLPH
ncbi:glycoside hydrolase family 3 protein [Chelonobacter oris]|uniref:glycoside hydrolase family 3 protein n=1 Tax=Chelonobacter oris TaxID=505317 RepID=UPI00190F81AA|nr:glycoside hydrolase family 3 N-terminal domain-containing protein [Chelonobacter oris]